MAQTNEYICARFFFFYLIAAPPSTIQRYITIVAYINSHNDTGLKPVIEFIDKMKTEQLELDISLIQKQMKNTEISLKDLSATALIKL